MLSKCPPPRALPRKRLICCPCFPREGGCRRKEEKKRGVGGDEARENESSRVGVSLFSKHSTQYHCPLALSCQWVAMSSFLPCSLHLLLLLLVSSSIPLWSETIATNGIMTARSFNFASFFVCFLKRTTILWFSFPFPG